MEEKEVKIQVPEGYEIDKENSTFECIKFKRKNISYEEILSIVFNKDKNDSKYNITYGFECKSFNEKLRDKISAIYKLMIVAKYLNDGWVPDWDNRKENKFYLYCYNNDIDIDWCALNNYNFIYFKSKKLAKQAIEILGEETIKQALGNNY